MAKSAEYRSKFGAFTGDIDVSIWVNNFYVDYETPNIKNHRKTRQQKCSIINHYHVFPFTSSGDVYIWEKSFQVGRKSPNKKKQKKGGMNGDKYAII